MALQLQTYPVHSVKLNKWPTQLERHSDMTHLSDSYKTGSLLSFGQNLEAKLDEESTEEQDSYKPGSLMPPKLPQLWQYVPRGGQISCGFQYSISMFLLCSIWTSIFTHKIDTGKCLFSGSTLIHCIFHRYLSHSLAKGTKHGRRKSTYLLPERSSSRLLKEKRRLFRLLLDRKISATANWSSSVDKAKVAH